MVCRRLAVGIDAVGIGAAGFVSADRSTVLFAPHLSWRNEPLRERLAARVGLDVVVDNDANAACWAEHRFGAGRGETHLIMVTLGTGIGSAFLYNGVLVPNTELGHLNRDGESIERWTAYSAMERESLSWEEWSARLQEFYSHVEFLFSPDLFVVGGGVSKHPEKFLPLLDLRTPIVSAVHRNASGIIGAAALSVD